MAPQVGFEPTTLRLTAECSTVELLRSNRYVFPFKQRFNPLSNRPPVLKSSRSAVPAVDAGSPPYSPACPFAQPLALQRPLRSGRPLRLPLASRTPSRLAPSPAGSRSTPRSRFLPRLLRLQSTPPPRTIPQFPALPRSPPSSRR